MMAAREAALRAHAQILEWNVPGRLIDTPLELVLVLERGRFRRHEAEHHFLSPRHEAQRLEAAGAFAVVLEEPAIHVRLVEHGLGDRIVAAFGEPGAFPVAAAGM